MKTRLFLSLIVCVAIASCHGQSPKAYYVSSSTGDDNNSGTMNAPWETIQMVNNQSFIPGDSILFKRGDTWRTPSDAAITANSSGTDEDGYSSYITYGAYGDGDRPRILGSNVISGWTIVQGNIWSLSLDYNPRASGYGAELFFVLPNDSIAWGVQRKYDASLSEFTQEYDWVWNDGVVYVYSESNPDTRYATVEAPRTSKLFLYNNYNYIATEGFEFAYATNMGVADSYNPGNLYGAKVTNNHIHHIGHKNSGQAFGISMKHSDALIDSNEINDCGRRNISINLYLDEVDEIIMEHVIIRNNYLHDGWHTTGIDGINSGYHILRDIHIYGNLIEDNKDLPIESSYRNLNSTSNFIYITVDPWATSSDIYIYNNIFKHCKAKQITVDGVDNLYICNNTFYGMAQYVMVTNSQNIIHCTDATSGGMGKYTIMNNIFYNDANPDYAPYANCIYIDYDVFNLAQDIDNNLYYGTDDGTGRLLNVFSQGVINEVWNADNYDEWLSFSGFDENSPLPSDPQFVNAPDDLGLNEDSPAIGVGKSFDWIKFDYYGNEMNNPPDIGAIQYGSVPYTALAEEVQLNLYPIPATGQLLTVELESDNPVKSFYLKLYNVSGQMVWQSDTYLKSNKESISINNNCIGFFIAEVIVDDSHSFTRKILLLDSQQ